jgi:hydroxyacylglutathione hydrolase
MSAQTRLFLCLQDNFGVLVHDPASGATAAIDAPEAPPIENALKATGWRLTDILVTHHHHDHTGGIEELKRRYRCRVVAPDAEAKGIPDVDETVRENDKVSVGGLEARVIETPGHTAGHISFHFPADRHLWATLCSR